MTTAAQPALRDKQPTALVQCGACGVEYDAANLPEVCPICADERQFVPDCVQRWVDPEDEHPQIDVVELEPGLLGLQTSDVVGIGQTAKVIVTEHGTVMFDVPAAITDDAVERVAAFGPMCAIMASHPHMYGLQNAWSEALGGVPVYVASADREWLPVEPHIVFFWEREAELVPGVRAIQVGGHFPGSAVVHWPGADGEGVLLSGDSVMVNPDGRSVSFMRSYPNRIPLSGAVALRIARQLEPLEFDRIYNNFDDVIAAGGSDVVRESARRHADWTLGMHDALT